MYYSEKAVLEWDNDITKRFHLECESKEKLEELIGKYIDIFDRLEKEQKSGNLSTLSLSTIIQLTYRVAYKLTKKQVKVQKKAGEVMGGKVLDLPEFRIYDQGKAEGKAEGLAEGAKEREVLKLESDRLRREIEQLKATLAK